MLTPAERIELVERLLTSLDPGDPDIDRAWVAEVERRLQDYQSGKTTARDAADVMAKHLKSK